MIKGFYGTPLLDLFSNLNAGRVYDPVIVDDPPPIFKQELEIKDESFTDQSRDFERQFYGSDKLPAC